MTKKTPKILVVDDLTDWRATVSGLLEDESYDVQAAASKSGALALLEKDQFDVAVLDMRLDETDEDNVEGLDLAEKIKHTWPAVQIIILTGYSTPDRLKRAMEPDSQGNRLVADFMEKTETDRIVQTVRKLLTT